MLEKNEEIDNAVYGLRKIVLRESEKELQRKHADEKTGLLIQIKNLQDEIKKMAESHQRQLQAVVEQFTKKPEKIKKRGKRS
jgi:hypothetical protein